jgi:hypothetical protein
MRELQGEVASSSRRRAEQAPAKVATGDAMPAAARKRLKMNKDTSATAAVNAPLADETEAWTPEEQQLHSPAPQVQAPPSFQIPGFVYFILTYFALNYFFG